MEKIETFRGLNDFSFLDQTDFKKKYATGPLENTIRFYIGGIRCGKCVRKLEDLALTVAGIKNIRVELGNKIASVEIDPATLSFSELAESIKKLGFVPTPLMTQNDEAELQKNEDRSDIIRLAVAGICAGNIMTYSFGNYFGVSGNLLTLFSWLSFTLYLPVVTYVAWPFYLGALSSFRQKRLSIDLPMAVASIFGFVFSFIQLIRGRSDFYFDSLSGFLFLILASRWVQKHLQRHFLDGVENVQANQLERVRKMNSSGWTWIPSERLEIGDDFLLLKEETVPVGAELVSAKGYFHLAWLTGEADSKLFLQGSQVPAGAKLISDSVCLKMKSSLAETEFGKILKNVQRFSMSKNRTVALSDLWAQWLLIFVFTVAILFLIFYWPVLGEEAIRRAIALIIVACPCAMAFGTPLALTSTLKKAKQIGLIVRNANVFQKVNAVKTIFFDKTGTLTDSNMTLTTDTDSIPDYYKQIILSLENKSQHPIAFSLRKAFHQFSGDLFPVHSFTEQHGFGVAGSINGKHYELRSSLLAEATTSCYLFENHQPLIKLTFSAHLRPHCLGVLNNLRRKGFRVVLLSGDKKDVVENLAKQLNFSAVDVHYEATPGKKVQIIQDNPHSMMIGDGVNDSLAMMQAHVGIAVAGSVEAALKSSDIYLVDPSLMPLESLIDISKECLDLIHQNLFISVGYNLVVGVMALAGLINPFVAAVLMPLSTGFILLTTWLRSRK